MSLPARQQLVLDAIESALEASESRLAAMFAMFARLTREEPVGVERLPRRSRQRSGRERRRLVRGGVVCLGRTRWRPGNSILLIPVLAAFVLMTALVIGVATGGSSTCAASPAHAWRTAFTCAAPPANPAQHPGSGRFVGIG